MIAEAAQAAPQPSKVASMETKQVQFPALGSRQCWQKVLLAHSIDGTL